MILAADEAALLIAAMVSPVTTSCGRNLRVIAFSNRKNKDRRPPGGLLFEIHLTRFTF